ncbi:MAG: type I restriction endonuclease subunit M, partial [Candidatus Omnitrophica bacterium]|nr:type I restriction endonuclease subunit M [Candidatus Omnitrophota bacterium]
FDKEGHPKALIETIAEDLLTSFRSALLLDAYDVYQHLMDYWMETMQDDCYLVAADGWVAKTHRIQEEIKSGTKKGEMKDKGWACDLIPKSYIVVRYFTKEQAELDSLQTEMEAVIAAMTEQEEEHGGEDGAFSELDKINKGEVSKRLKEIKSDPDYADEAKILKEWASLEQRQSDLRSKVKEAEAALDALAYEKYPQLSVDEIKTLVVDDKWLTTLESAVQGELDRVSQTLTTRIRQLAERYDTPLPKLVGEVTDLSARVDEHLKRMGAVWN